MPSMTKRSRKMLILFLALVILLSFFSSCRIGNAPRACDVLSEMLAAAKGLPVGSFYSSKSEKGASNYLSESLMTALYGTDSFPEVFARAEETAVWLSSGIYACEFAVQATIQHIAIEGKCYFINADMIITKASYPTDLNEKNTVEQLPEKVCRGGSCIIDPYGHYVTEPVWDEETIIYAELDMSLPSACKMEHDAVGHYARPDVLELIVNDR